MQAPSVDGDGYLVDPDQWTENWARHTAAAMNIDLTPEHWEAIRFMRAFYEEHRGRGRRTAGPGLPPTSRPVQACRDAIA